MKLIRDIDAGQFRDGCVLSIGNFDGIHLGHQRIVRRVIAKSRAYGTASVIMSFEPHPHEYFSATNHDRIMGLREKYLALKEIAPDYLFVMRFNRQLAQTSAEAFVEHYLIGKLRVKRLIVGDDFRFGKKRRGDFCLLNQYARRGCFELENTATLELDAQRISSTRIRQALHEANFELVRRMLGRPFFISGRISHGRKQGRKLGFPTINIHLNDNRNLLNGVFVVEVQGSFGIRQGVANLGYRPTVQGRGLMLEVHIFDFDKECYGQSVTIRFRRKLRDEIRFDSLDALKQQIHMDVSHAQQLLAIHA